MKKRCTLLLLVFLALLALPAIADDGGEHAHPAEDAVNNGVFGMKVAAIFLIIATCIALPLKKHLDETGKKIFFWTITVIVMASTLYFGATIIYENVLSVTGGPIHWHADYQVWACGERIDLVDPSFPKNKIGTPLFHEHDDDRIHVEGTVLELSDVNFGGYFEVIGGVLEEGHLKYPGEDGMVDYRDGDTCPDGSSGTVQVYVNGKLKEDYSDYEIYPDPYVPPGDCVIVEFDDNAEPTTDKICSSWETKGWNYDNFQRRRAQVGDTVWQ